MEDDYDIVMTDPTGRFERYRKSLGKGAHKEVFKAFDQEEGVEVAWNQIRVGTFSSPDVNRYTREIQILESLRNDNIINILHSWRAPSSQPDKDDIFFITELMTSGTLTSYVKKTKGSIKPKIIRNWCKQILSGLHYLHTREHPIIHRDLKGDNIFINGNNGQAKIGDLGLAAIKATQHLSSVLGTPQFMAPELYDERYDEKVDIYAFGMVILEILSKNYPYSECTNPAQIYRKVSSGIKPAALYKIEDLEIRAFVDLCLEHDPEKRPSAEQLLNHPFLTASVPSNGSSSDLKNFDSGQLSDSVLSVNSSFGVIEAEQHQFHISRHSTPSKPVASCEVEVVDPIGEEEVTLKMTYHTGTASCEIRFPFNLADDTATDVVSELVKENLILAIDEQLTRRRIEETIRLLFRQRGMASLGNSSVVSEHEQPHLERNKVPDRIHSPAPTSEELVIVPKVPLGMAVPVVEAETNKTKAAEPESIPQNKISTTGNPSSKRSSSIDSTSLFSHASLPNEGISYSTTPPSKPSTHVTQPNYFSLDRGHIRPARSSSSTGPILDQSPLDVDPETVKRKNDELAEKLKQLQEFNMNSFDDTSRKLQQVKASDQSRSNSTSPMTFATFNPQPPSLDLLESKDANGLQRPLVPEALDHFKVLYQKQI